MSHSLTFEAEPFAFPMKERSEKPCHCPKCRAKRTEEEEFEFAEEQLVENPPGGSRIQDRTAFTPRDKRKANRDMKKVYALVLHQMAFSRGTNNTKYDTVNAHFAILPDGQILQLYPLSALLWTSNGFNAGSVGVEFAGNFPNTKGKCWSAAKFGCHRVTPAQIEAGRYLVDHLIRVMKLTHILAHRQSSGTRENDPGPDIWAGVGQWAVENRGLKDGGPGFKVGTGNPIPDAWRNWGRTGGRVTREMETSEDFEAELPEDSPLATKLDALRNWTKLLLLKVRENIRASLSARKMHVQYAHNESYSNDLNIDLYPVRINKFPIHRGNVMTPTMMLKHIRININSLLDTTISSFHPYSTSVDAPRWASDDPTGAVLKIRIRPDNAAVVVSSATPTGWTFTTVETPDTGTHPVSGHRTFFIANRGSVYYFMNKGLDMTSSGIAGLGLPFFGEYGYGMADKLWNSFQDKLVEFINKNGGDAKKEKPYSQRIEWRFVFHRYKHALERVFGKGAGSSAKSPFLDIIN